jgi:hypothetical protein
VYERWEFLLSSKLLRANMLKMLGSISVLHIYVPRSDATETGSFLGIISQSNTNLVPVPVIMETWSSPITGIF